MTKKTVIPRIGYVLRAAIKAAGYRPYIDHIGLGKDLDDLAIEMRPSVTSELLQKIDDAVVKELATDCGNEWAQFFKLAWFRTCEAIQMLVQNVDTSPLPQDQGQELFFKHFTVPMLSGFMRLCLATRRGPDANLWWGSPFLAWVHFAASKGVISTDELLANLANQLDADQRTIDRWISGESVGKVIWPIRLNVLEAMGNAADGRLNESNTNLLTGWLIVAIAFQSLPPAVRDSVCRDFNLRSQEPWSISDALITLTQHGFDQGSSSVRSAAVPILEDIQHLFTPQPRDFAEIRQKLDLYQELILQERPDLQEAHQYIHDWFSARLAALQGKINDALRLYATSVKGVWWYGGQNQQPIINEALLYAVGVGDKVAAEHYWDKTFMLGLNVRPKRTLDEQEMRRIAFGFEKMFSPQKAKDRIPPPNEVILRDGVFSVSSKQLKKPNQQVKFAEGRTRRTPLMDAIRDGTIDDVKLLIDAGGNPNDFIKESGEGPLMYAMRRACDRKDPIIMEYFLGLDLLPETVNRPASTKRETPLKIAIEMANANAVTRLIQLGANVENACDYVPSGLCYAMVLLHGSLYREDTTQELAYFSGKTRADAYDAKEGAVLDAELAARRQHMYALANSNEQNYQIYKNIMNYFTRPVDDRRQVILALLHGGADANCRYKVAPHHLAQWTPTLFAAQVGDLDVFKMLVEHLGPNRGDPDQTLMPPSSLERFDALWIAIDHGRHAIVSYLMNRQNKLQ